MTEWISIKDRLPPYDEIVILNYKYIADVQPEIFYIRRLGFRTQSVSCSMEHYDEYKVLHNKQSIHDTYITHWIPLPEAPK